MALLYIGKSLVKRCVRDRERERERERGAHKCDYDANGFFYNIPVIAMKVLSLRLRLSFVGSTAASLLHHARPCGCSDGPQRPSSN